MNTESTTPVRAEDRVSDVLVRDEALLEVFVGYAPHFAKLRNRTMRRVMARLVTVEQAARMAGVGVEGLLGALNHALGITAMEEPAVPVTAPPDEPPRQRRPPDAHEVVVDVREDLRAGREPFSMIMRAVGTLEGNDVLRLRTTFEPVPLFHVLGKRGFAHEVAEHGPEDWSAWFWRPAAGGAPQPTASPVVNLEAMPQFSADGTPLTWLDVRGLEPPEPMVRTLEALEGLADGRVLVQVNVRVPRFLLPVLEERGFAYEVRETGPDMVQVHIRRPPPAAIHQSSGAESMPVASNELDVRVIPPREKHPTIFSRVDALKAGDSLVIINDHDPRPLKYQLDAEHPGSYGWDYEATGPEVWRVKITRR
jgi:uncharacterized protein (DUF2249 family)